MATGPGPNHRPIPVSRHALSLLALLAFAACALTSFLGEEIHPLTPVEQVSMPIAMAGFLLIALLFLLVPPGHLQKVAHGFRLVAGALLLAGLYDGLTDADSNLIFYIAWLPLFQAAIFFTTETRHALKWSLLLFGASAALAVLLTLFGPLPWTNIHVQAVYSSLIAQLAAIVLFHFVARYREALAAETTRADLLEKTADALRIQADAARQAQARAEAADQAKSTFLAMASHELRTPLNAIIGFSEVMTMKLIGDLSPGYQDYARNIQQSGRHLLHVIEDILDLSRVEQGGLDLRHERVEVAALLENCRLLLERQAAAKRVTLRCDAAAAPAAVLGDGPRLTQILVNLMTNAVKFNRPGGQVVVSAAADPAGSLTFEVADTGIGMRETDYDTALSPFKQLDSGYARHHEGIGLGLYIAKSLAELHGGSLGLRSRQGEGTTVSVTLPAWRVAQAGDPAAISPATVAPGSDDARLQA